MGEYYTIRRGVLSTETTIDRKEMHRLRELAAIGQAYEAAMRTMRGYVASFVRGADAYDDGWRDAMVAFARDVAKERYGAVAETEASSDLDF